MERLNELQVFRADGDRARGFKTVLVSETNHPFWEHWWPPGHIVGWGETFVHELHHMLRAISIVFGLLRTCCMSILSASPASVVETSGAKARKAA